MREGTPIPPRSPEENEQLRQQRLEEILEASRRVFSRKGLGATKVADIAREAEISHGLLYHYFSGKDEIFLTIIEQSLQGALWVTSAAREQPGTPWNRISWLFHNMVLGGRQAPEYVLITIQAATSDAVPEGTRDIMEKYGEPIFHNVVDLIIAGQESGDIVQGDPRKLANAMFSCVQGLVIATVTGSTDPEVIPDPEMMLRMLKA